MNTLDNLIVRACKSKDPHTRLKSVYRRFYLLDIDVGCDHFINLLARICDQYKLIPFLVYVDKTSPRNKWMYTDNPYEDQRYGVLLSTVRHSEISSYDGYREPLYFRERKKGDFCATPLLND